MAHKTLIDGTSYNIVGGTTMVDGTSRRVAAGRTLINGTGYDVPFVEGEFNWGTDGSVASPAWVQHLITFLDQSDEATIKATIPAGSTKIIDGHKIIIIGRCQDGPHTITCQVHYDSRFNNYVKLYENSGQNIIIEDDIYTKDFSTFFPSLVNYIVPTTRRYAKFRRRYSNDPAYVIEYLTKECPTWFKLSMNEIDLPTTALCRGVKAGDGRAYSPPALMAMENITDSTVSCQVGKNFSYEVYTHTGDRDYNTANIWYLFGDNVKSSDTIALRDQIYNSNDSGGSYYYYGFLGIQKSVVGENNIYMSLVNKTMGRGAIKSAPNFSTISTVECPAFVLGTSI